MYDSKGTLNKVMLIGRLGQDPELKYTQSGVATLTLSLATNTSYKDSAGNAKENTEWTRVVFWRKAAELVAQYSKKGDKLYVEGKLQTRSWEQDGQKRYATEVVVENQQFLGSNERSTASSDSQPEPSVNDMADGVGEQDDLPF